MAIPTSMVAGDSALWTWTSNVITPALWDLKLYLASGAETPTVIVGTANILDAKTFDLKIPATTLLQPGLYHLTLRAVEKAVGGSRNL